MTTERTIDVGAGIGIHTRVDGPSDGPAVILLHGYLGNGEQWDRSVEPLTRAGFLVVRPDFRGHGGSTNVGDESAYDFDLLTRDTSAVVDALGIDRYHLVGHSMGGLIAMLIASGEHGDRLRSLMLVDCSPLPGEPGRPTVDRIRRVIAYRLGVGRTLGLLAPVLSRVSVGQPPDQTRRERRAMLDELRTAVDQLDPAGLVALGEALQRHDDLRPRLARIDVATTVVVGEFDIARLKEGADALGRGIEGARFTEIAGAGHSPPIERPDAFNATLLAHLRD